jgi:hypothetical protein
VNEDLLLDNLGMVMLKLPYTWKGLKTNFDPFMKADDTLRKICINSEKKRLGLKGSLIRKNKGCMLKKGAK